MCSIQNFDYWTILVQQNKHYFSILDNNINIHTETFSILKFNKILPRYLCLYKKSILYLWPNLTENTNNIINENQSYKLKYSTQYGTIIDTTNITILDLHPSTTEEENEDRRN